MGAPPPSLMAKRTYCWRHWGDKNKRVWMRGELCRTTASPFIIPAEFKTNTRAWKVQYCAKSCIFMSASPQNRSCFVNIAQGQIVWRRENENYEIFTRKTTGRAKSLMQFAALLWKGVDASEIHRSRPEQRSTHATVSNSRGVHGLTPAFSVWYSGHIKSVAKTLKLVRVTGNDLTAVMHCETF